MKVLFVPFAILVFIVFLLVLGAVGLGVATLVIGLVGKAWRIVSGADRRERRAAERQQA